MHTFRIGWNSFKRPPQWRQLWELCFTPWQNRTKGTNLRSPANFEKLMKIGWPDLAALSLPSGPGWVIYCPCPELCLSNKTINEQPITPPTMIPSNIGPQGDAFSKYLQPWPASPPPRWLPWQPWSVNTDHTKALLAEVDKYPGSGVINTGVKIWM